MMAKHPLPPGTLAGGALWEGGGGFFFWGGGGAPNLNALAVPPPFPPVFPCQVKAEVVECTDVP